MAWIIAKSAGDETSFTVLHVEGEIGHPYQVAQKYARQITEAMKNRKEPVDALRLILARIDGTNINTPIKDMADTWLIGRVAVAKAQGKE